MRYFYWLLFVVFLFFVLRDCSKSSKVRTEKRDSAMTNGLEFKGDVTAIHTSRNHSFGVISINIDRIDMGNFVDTALKGGIYPYKIKGGKAELYGIIPDGIQTGDSITVISSKKKAIYYYIVSKERYEGYIGVVVDPNDIEYAKNNSMLMGKN